MKKVIVTILALVLIMGCSKKYNKIKEVELDNQYKKNAHIQLDAKGNIIKKQCAICHEVFPEPGAVLKLVSPVVDICSQCHKLFDHPDVNHLVKMTDNKLKSLQEYQQIYQVIFPLDEKGFITCITCHNPHAKGVLKGLGGMGAGEYLLLRGISFEEACTPCHSCC